MAGASLKTLMGLVNKSFVQTVGSGRYDVHELLRQYGEQRLYESPENSEQAQDLHCMYFADFVRQRHIEFEGLNGKAALHAFSDDYENLRLAWEQIVQQARWDDLWKMSHSFFDFSYHIYRLEDAQVLYAQAAAKLEEIGAEGIDQELLGVLLAHQGYLCVALAADFDLSTYRRAVTIMSKITPSNAVSAFSLSLLGFYGAHKVELSEGERLMRDSIALCRVRGYTKELTGSIRNLMQTFTNLNINVAEMNLLIKEAAGLAAQSDNPPLMAVVQYQQAHILCEEGNYAEAKPLYTESCRIFEEYGDLLRIGTCHMSLGGIAYEEGDYAEALHQFKQTLTFYSETTNPFHIPLVLNGVARTLAAQGKGERAVELCHLVRNIEGITVGVPPDVMPLLAQLEAELQPDVFAAAVERGKTRELDATVQELLAEFSQPDSTPTVQPLLDPLTRRELEILNLAAVGCSNREIAEELFLSPGTVKWYLTEIYSKLGVNGRMQAIARSRDLNLLS